MTALERSAVLIDLVTRIDTAGSTQYLTLRITWRPSDNPAEGVINMAGPLLDFSTKPEGEGEEPETEKDTGEV